MSQVGRGGVASASTFGCVEPTVVTTTVAKVTYKNDVYVHHDVAVVELVVVELDVGAQAAVDIGTEMWTVRKVNVERVVAPVSLS